MKLRPTYLFLLMLLLTSISSYAQTFWFDDFEGAAPTSGVRLPSIDAGYGGPPFTSYFKRTLKSDINAPSLLDGYNGSYIWASENNDAALDGTNGNQAEAQSVTWNNINISGRTGISFAGLFAAAGNPVWDHGSITTNTDFILVEYNIDNTGWYKLLEFRPTVANGNGYLAEDTNGDGVGDGSQLTGTFTEFTKNISQTGTTMSLRITVLSNSLAEEAAFDFIRLSAAVTCTPPSFVEQPASATMVCPESNKSISVTASGATSYQWQVDSTGDGNWKDLANTGKYSGTGSNTLNIQNISTNQNNHKFRCKAFNNSADCFSTSSATTLTVSNITIKSSSQSNVSCFNGANGTAAVTAEGGMGPLSYTWIPSGGTKSVASGLSANTYKVIITDQLNCNIQHSFTITQPVAALSAVIEKTDVHCNGGSTGWATVTPSGGTAPYTYSWSKNGGIAKTASGLSAGEYSCTVTDNNGCDVRVNTTITQPPPFSIITSQTDVTCNGGNNGSATVDVSGGTAPYFYSWSPSGGTGSTASGLAPNKYIVTITDNNTCQTTREFNLTQPAPIKLQLERLKETICSGEQTDIELKVFDPNTVYSWTATTKSGNATGWSSGSGTLINQTITGEGVIEYTITSANGVCNGPTLKVPVNIVPALSILTHPQNQTVNQGQSTVFSVTASGAISYQWQVDAGSGYTNIANNSIYSGATSSELTISNAPAGLMGYKYRCQLTGNCVTLTTDDAVVTIITKQPQTISLASTDEKVYGTQEYDLQLEISSGLDPVITSSNTDIVEVVNNKLRIKKAGEVTITVSQPGDDNYFPATSVQQTLTITRRPLTVSLNATPLIKKVYDANTTATLVDANFTLSNTVEGDNIFVAATAEYESQHVGTNINITVSDFVLSGLDSDNYVLNSGSLQTKGNITQRGLTVSLVPGTTIVKDYDGNAGISLQASDFIINGLMLSEQVTIGQHTAAFNNKNAGSGKPVTINGFKLAGTGKDNYILTTSSLSATGTINTKQITVSFAETPVIARVYDGTTAAVIPEAKYQLNTPIAGDEVSVTAKAVFADANAGESKTINVTEFALQGNDKSNYHLGTSSATITGNIQKANITVNLKGSPAVSKVYDGTTTATIAPDNYQVNGIIGDDQVLLNNPAQGSYDNKNAGTSKQVTVTGLLLSGAQSGNYQLNSTSVSANIGAITQKPVTVTALPKFKRYGAPDPVLEFSTSGLLSGESLLGALSREQGSDAGTYAITTGSLSGGNNYAITEYVPASLTITPAPLVIKAEDKEKKQGAANPEFTFSYEGLVNGDQPSDLATPPVAHTSATAGSLFGNYVIEVTGASSPNYNISFRNGTLLVTPAADEKYSMLAWSGRRDQIDVKIYSDVAQKAAIILYSETGHRLVLQENQLQPGVNHYRLNVGHLTVGTYVVAVNGQKFKQAKRVVLK